MQRIDERLEGLLPMLRPEARVIVTRLGYLSRRRKAGERMMRVVGGWCVFFNRGCTLHRLGDSEGSATRYKPWMCAVFPLAKDAPGRWYVRQKGYKREVWNLPCLDPETSVVGARDSLRQEIELVEQWESST
jgi:hypothetical protein